MTLTSKDITFTAGNHRYHITDTKPKVYIPSVTTICGLLDKPFLVQWAANCASEAAVAAYMAHEGALDDEHVEAFIATGKAAHRDVRDEGANVGTAVHHAVKMALVPGWVPPEDELVDGGIEAEMALMAFEEWHGEHIIARGIEPLLVERIVVHPDGSYVGTFDLVAKAPSEDSPTGFVLETFDWKTSNQSDSNPCALYPEYLFQIAAYRRALMLSPEYDDILGAHPWGQAWVVALGKNGQLSQTPLENEELEAYADAFMHLVEVMPVYRQAQSHIRAFNKAEKARRADEGLDELMKEKV
jgi:hypothetical protein